MNYMNTYFGGMRIAAAKSRGVNLVKIRAAEQKTFERKGTFSYGQQHQDLKWVKCYPTDGIAYKDATTFEKNKFFNKKWSNRRK